MARINLVFASTRLYRVLWLSFAGLWLGNLGALALVHHAGISDAWGLVTLFHLDREQNLPTLFSVLLLLGAGGLARLIAGDTAATRPQSQGWHLVALILALMAIDEFASIHERIDAALRYYLGAERLPYAAWPLPYALGVLVLSAKLGPWLIGLDRLLALRLLGAGAIYLSGAMGIELVAGEYLATIDPHHLGATDLKRDLLATIEESLEILGLIWLVLILADRASRIEETDIGEEKNGTASPVRTGDL